MIKFGTGGWRAVIGDGFTKKNMQLLTAALCEKMKRDGCASCGIVLGYDRRFLSKESMRWCAKAAAAAGITASLINQSSPTPLIMFYMMQHRLPYGMMITASHNPAIYNGIKVFTEGGRDAEQAVTDEIERIAGTLDADGISEMDYEEALSRGLIREIYPQNEYLDHILGKLDTDAIRSAHLKVAADPMFGVSEVPLQTLLLTTRCDVAMLHNTHDALFGGRMPAPNAATMRQLSTRVMDYSFDIGVATDGDADRLGVIDDTGRYLTANDILVLLYYYMLKYRGERGAVVRNVATTHMLDRVAARFGQECYEVPVGFKYISAKMAETDALIGGESSGGLTVRGHINGKDGIYAAMLLVEMLAVTGRKLSGMFEEIREECGSIFMEERNCRLKNEAQKQMLWERLFDRRELPAFPEELERVSYLDGVKVYFKCGGWVIARFSGTEPLLRIFCEMPDGMRAAKICGLFEDFLGISKGRMLGE